MNSQLITLDNNRFELLTDGRHFLGIGKVWIGETQVRSGRLPWRAMTQAYSGKELAGLELLGVDESPAEVRIRLRAIFKPLFTKLKWDHSTDPIHEVDDWDIDATAGEGELDLVLAPATDRIEEVEFTGFAFHWEYNSADTPIFYLYDMASWELDGDITGATAISQSSCSDPIATFTPDRFWTTEGLIHWEDEASKANPVMTHNLPRWASHQSFDYQYKGDHTLIGLWERVDLIRSVLRREAGKPELKVFDKYIFDETLEVATATKRILLSTAPRTAVEQQNLWTWTLDEVHRRARAEFDLHEEPVLPRLTVNYWVNFTIDKYYKDLLPAAMACGFKALFVDHLNKNNMTVGYPFGTMCCSFEVEPAPELGGTQGLKDFFARCQQHGILPFSWCNPSQSCVSPLFTKRQRPQYTPDWKEWYIRLPDTRSPYCGAYIPEGAGFDLSQEEPREYWTNALIKIKEETGHYAYLWDSFYNSAFMTVSYANGHPHTTWRGVLQALKKLQDAGLHFMIESFGPFGEVQHGCPKSYNIDNLFACYKISLGSGYTTIPSGEELAQTLPDQASQLYFILAHMSKPDFPLWINGKRIDEIWTAAHRQALADYYANREHMTRRFLQQDGQSVLWHDASGTSATLWNFAARTVSLPGTVTDLTTGTELPAAESYTLEPWHTYAITGVAVLPREVGAKVWMAT